jgi:hypothetical protein
VSDQSSKDENVCSCLNGIRFVPKMPPLLGHAPSAVSDAGTEFGLGRSSVFSAMARKGSLNGG